MTRREATTGDGLLRRSVAGQATRVGVTSPASADESRVKRTCGRTSLSTFVCRRNAGYIFALALGRIPVVRTCYARKDVIMKR